MAEDVRFSRALATLGVGLGLLALGLMLSACASGPSPSRYDESDRAWFEVDVLSGLGDGGQPRATVTVSIPRRSLVYFQRAGGFVSEYRIRAIQRVDGRAMRMQEWAGVAHAPSFEQTRSAETEQRTFAVDLLDVAADPQRFQLEVQVEIEGTRRVASRTVVVEPRRYELGGLALAELALYQRSVRDDGTGPELVPLTGQLPDAREFRRRENRSFDLATGEPWLLIRVFDLRATPSGEPYRITLRARPRTGDQQAWIDTLAIAPSGNETAVLVRLPARAFVFGTNSVQVELPTAEGVEIALENLGLDLEDERSWNANLQQIEVLGTGDEIRDLREAATEERRVRWEAFWERRDPDPSTAENERLEEHYRRVGYARAHLQDGFNDGALSDRGRIWILHGRPDVIDTSAQGFRSYTNYEVWTYRDLGLVYYFQDSDGFGTFRLVWREVG